MGAMKRPAAAMKKASASGKPAAKRAAKPAAKKPRVDPLKKDLDQICRGVGLDRELPVEVKEMLQNMVPLCLNLYKEDRHAFQNDATGMVERVFVNIEREMAAEIQEAQREIEGLGEERVKREGAWQEAQANHTAKETRKSQAKEALAEAARALQEAKAALATAQKEQKEGDRDLVSAEGRLAELKSCLTEKIEPLAEGSVPQGSAKKTVSSLVQTLKTFGFDESLTTAIPTSISRAPAERGQFDQTVIQQLRGEIGTRIAEFQKLLDEGAGAKASRAAKVEETEAALVAAKGRHDAQSEALAAAQAEMEEQAKELQQRTSELENLEPEANKLKKRAETLGQKLASFRDGPFAALRRLAERTAPADAIVEAPAAFAGDTACGEPTAETAQAAVMVEAPAASAGDTAFGEPTPPPHM